MTIFLYMFERSQLEFTSVYLDWNMKSETGTEKTKIKIGKKAKKIIEKKDNIFSQFLYRLPSSMIANHFEYFMYFFWGCVFEFFFFLLSGANVNRPEKTTSTRDTKFWPCIHFYSIHVVVVISSCWRKMQCPIYWSLVMH